MTSGQARLPHWFTGLPRRRSRRDFSVLFPLAQVGVKQPPAGHVGHVAWSPSSSCACSEPMVFCTVGRSQARGPGTSSLGGWWAAPASWPPGTGDNASPARQCPGCRSKSASLHETLSLECDEGSVRGGAPPLQSGGDGVPRKARGPEEAATHRRGFSRRESTRPCSSYILALENVAVFH